MSIDQNNFAEKTSGICFELVEIIGNYYESRRFRRKLMVFQDSTKLTPENFQFIKLLLVVQKHGNNINV